MKWSPAKTSEWARQVLQTSSDQRGIAWYHNARACFTVYRVLFTLFPNITYLLQCQLQQNITCSLTCLFQQDSFQKKKKKSCGAIEFPKKPEFSTSQYCCIGSWVSNIWTLGHIQSKSLLLTCSLLGSKHKVSCLKKSQILLKVLASLVFIFKYSIHYHHSTLNYWAILQV